MGTPEKHTQKNKRARLGGRRATLLISSASTTLDLLRTPSPRSTNLALQKMLTRAAAAIRTARTARSMSLAHGKDPAYMKTPESFQKVLDTFAKYRACAVLRTPTAEAAPKAMDAAINGGFEIVEFTLTTPGCLDCVADYRAKYDGKVMVGCGTVMDINDAKKAMDAGSEFLVAPVRRRLERQGC